ncbi:type II toxin-antitoxin system VapB family antitoxin [Rhizobium leguminosarum]|uniref:type II toxin-antitoxin system VapB family antitoxin n=1 Tax=Rhizobium leguminosarum TaxID=384 RepID=UPI001FDFA2CA|nr:type II toxin-antitoxin system VapB family antitoxin [Rhizobium leguminosarum]
MPTTIDIDDGLLDAAMIVTGLATKEAAVEQALRILIESHRRKNAIADLAGIGWEGDLEERRLRGISAVSPVRRSPMPAPHPPTGTFSP